MRINPWRTHEIKISPFVVSAVVATFHPPRPPTTANQEQHSSTPPFTLHAIFSTIYFNLLLPSSSVHFVQGRQQRRNKDSLGRLLSVLYSLGHCLWKEEKFYDYSLRIRSWKKKELLQQKAKVGRALYWREQDKVKREPDLLGNKGNGDLRPSEKDKDRDDWRQVKMYSSGSGHFAYYYKIHFNFANLKWISVRSFLLLLYTAAVWLWLLAT